jgi:hypothetical protein
MMKLSASAMALAVVLAWPTIGEAQSQTKSGAKARTTTTTQQQQRAARQAYASTPRSCAAEVENIGCLGWDPDGSVRLMMHMDRFMYDD